MAKFHVFTPTIEEFIFLLDHQENIRWKKIWHISMTTIGVYFIEVYPSKMSAESALLNVVIEHDKEEKFCQIWLEPFGTMSISPDKTMRNLIRSFGHLATKNKWHFERVPTAYRGDTCPYCNATYVYRDIEAQRSSIRICQNCGKQFDVDEPLEVEREWDDIRFRRTPCPYCQAIYIYKKGQIQEDGTVVCQNCEGKFVLQIDDWTRYSYEWYREEDDE